MTNILIEKNIRVPNRDGVQLATDIYRLEGALPTPVLVVRTPYNKDGLTAGGDTFDILRAVQASYTVVAQDVRGRYASEGAFNPHVQEIADSLDAFVWATAQPWSNGVVGTFGGSTCGPRRMCFYRATASAWRFRAATSPASTATATPAGTSPAKQPINTNRVFHNAAHPSRLILPIIEL